MRSKATNVQQGNVCLEESKDRNLSCSPTCSSTPESVCSSQEILRKNRRIAPKVTSQPHEEFNQLASHLSPQFISPVSYSAPAPQVLASTLTPHLVNSNPTPHALTFIQNPLLVNSTHAPTPQAQATTQSPQLVNSTPTPQALTSTQTSWVNIPTTSTQITPALQSGSQSTTTSLISPVTVSNACINLNTVTDIVVPVTASSHHQSTSTAVLSSISSTFTVSTISCAGQSTSTETNALEIKTKNKYALRSRKKKQELYSENKFISKLNCDKTVVERQKMSNPKKDILAETMETCDIRESPIRSCPPLEDEHFPTELPTHTSTPVVETNVRSKFPLSSVRNLHKAFQDASSLSVSVNETVSNSVISGVSNSKFTGIENRGDRVIVNKSPDVDSTSVETDRKKTDIVDCTPSSSQTVSATCEKEMDDSKNVVSSSIEDREEMDISFEKEAGNISPSHVKSKGINSNEQIQTDLQTPTKKNIPSEGSSTFERRKSNKRCSRKIESHLTSPQKFKHIAPKALSPAQQNAPPYVPLPKISPKRKELNRQVRHILPKAFMFESKTPSPTKTAALVLSKKAKQHHSHRSPVKLLPKPPHFESTTVNRISDLTPSKVITRSQTGRIKGKIQLGH